MTHDGSFDGAKLSKQALEASKLVRVIQRGFIYQLNHSRVAIALIGEITFQDTKVLSQVISPNIRF